MVHLPQNGPIGFDPQPYHERVPGCPSAEYCNPTRGRWSPASSHVAIPYAGFLKMGGPMLLGSQNDCHHFGCSHILRHISPKCLGPVDMGRKHQPNPPPLPKKNWQKLALPQERGRGGKPHIHGDLLLLLVPVFWTWRPINPTRFPPKIESLKGPWANH